jgi:hypothetical protein
VIRFGFGEQNSELVKIFAAFLGGFAAGLGGLLLLLRFEANVLLPSFGSEF